MNEACKCRSNEDVFLPRRAEVLKARPVTALETFFEFRFSDGGPLGHAPGQFVEVSVPGVGEAPISVSSAPGLADNAFQMVVRNAGNVTGAMHRLKPGDWVGIRGPFGKGFPVDAAMKGRDVVFICGGIGLVPVRSAIQHVLANRRNYGKIFILYGSKSPSDILFREETRQWAAADGVEYLETVDKGDDGWTGHVGVITTLMPEIKINPRQTVAVVCGPPIMYKFVLIELDKMGLNRSDMYVSLERNMKCGVGKCGHCQINGVYVCQDGPVFDYKSLENIMEAFQ